MTLEQGRSLVGGGVLVVVHHRPFPAPPAAGRLKVAVPDLRHPKVRPGMAAGEYAAESSALTRVVLQRLSVPGLIVTVEVHGGDRLTEPLLPEQSPAETAVPVRQTAHHDRSARVGQPYAAGARLDQPDVGGDVAQPEVLVVRLVP